jgi:hypothetical protein
MEFPIDCPEIVYGDDGSEGVCGASAKIIGASAMTSYETSGESDLALFRTRCEAGHSLLAPGESLGLTPETENQAIDAAIEADRREMIAVVMGTIRQL